MNKALTALALSATLALGAHAQTAPAYPGSYGWGMMGPGMMGPGGYGCCGMGPGMMGPGSYGWGMMGPGMMGPGNYGWGAMGPGATGGWPSGVTSDQQAKIAQIQKELRAKQWPLMQQMQELTLQSNGSADEQTERRLYESQATLQRQMFDNMIEARKRTEAVFTPQQREQMRLGSSR